MEYWSDLYLELAEKINERMTDVQWIDLWHEQISYLETEHPFPTPAVFISFNMLNAEDHGLLAQNCDTQIDFYMFYETFADTYSGSYNQDSAIDYLRALTDIHKLFHGTNGRHYSQMRRVAMATVDSGNAGNLYRISFACNVYDDSAMKQYIDKEVNDIVIIREDTPKQEPESTYEVDVN